MIISTVREVIEDYEVFIKAICSDKLESELGKVKIKEGIFFSRSSECYTSNLHYYHSTTQNQLFLSFMTNSYTPKNYVYEANNNLNEHIYIEVKWELADGTFNTVEYFSNNVVNSFINPTSTDPYIYNFEAPVGANLLSVRVGSGDVSNCEWLGHSTSCNLRGTHGCGYTAEIAAYVDAGNIPNGFIDVSQFICGQNETDYATLCLYPSHLEGEVIDGDLHLSFDGLSQGDFNQQLNETSVTAIDILVTGNSSSSTQSFTLPLWNSTMNSFDIESWSDYIPNFSSFTSFEVQFNLYDSNSNAVSCNSVSDLTINSNSDICKIFNILTERAPTNTKLRYQFTTPLDPNHLIDGLNEIGLTINEAEALIENNMDQINFTLSYSTGGAYQQTSAQVDISGGFDLESFKVNFQVAEFSNLSGALLIEYTDVNNETQSCLKSPISVIYEEEEENTNDVPTLDCSALPVDLGVLSQDLMTDVDVGDVVKINGFPLLILDIASGNNSTGMNGEGIIPLPFGEKQLFVDFSSLKINVDNHAISGQAIGKNGPDISSFPDFNLPPLYLGGEICVPPPTNGGLDGNGIDPVTGLNGYGFDPNTGLHYLTNTEYDPNGFDAEGNHEDTNEIWNEDGCTRDGILYAPNPETGEMENTNQPCDPTGGAADPEALDSFKTTIKPLLSDSLEAVFNEKETALFNALHSQQGVCDSMIALLKTDNYINDPMAYGVGDALIEFGMSKEFIKKPELLQIQGNRGDKQLNTEKLHIALYDCDVSENKLVLQHADFGTYRIRLETDIKTYVEEKIDNLTQNELEELQDPVKFRAWLLVSLLEFISNDSGVDYSHIDSSQENEEYYNLDQNPYLQESKYYDALVSTGNEVAGNSSRLEALSFEYEQGFSEIMGYPRPIVMEALRKYQLASASSMEIESLLPLSIDESTSRFDITIMVSDVRFYPTTATMDVAAVVTDKDNANQKIAFGADNISLSPGALAPQSTKIALLNDVGIRLNNASRLFLKSGTNATYIKWDCNGFAGLYIDGSIQFCREYVLPLHETTLEVITDESVLYELDINYLFPDFGEFKTEISGKPFELTSMRGYKWEVGLIGIDMTTEPIEGQSSLVIPSDYVSEFYDPTTQKLDDLWKGYYAKDLKLKLPKDLFGGNSTYSVEVNSLIIDGTGLTSHITVGNDPGIVSWEEGNANGWQMSIEELDLLILQNSIAGGGFGGRIGVPVLEGPLEYDATMYKNNILFSVNPDTTSTFTPFGATVTLYKNSYIQGEYNDQGFFAKAHLNGELSFGGEEGNAIADLVLPELRFQALEMQNVKENDENKLKFSAGRWGIKTPKENTNSNPEDDKPIFSGFGISVTDLGVYSNATNDGMFLRVGVDVDIIKESLTGGGSFEIHGKMDSTVAVFKMKYDKFKVNELAVNGSIKGILKVDGFVQWYDDTNANTNANKFGKGFRGGLDAEIEKLFPGIEVSAAAQFGTKDGEDYFFIDMVASLGKALTLGPVTFNKLGGGFSNGMVPNYGVIDPAPTFLTPTELRASPLGTTLTGVQYLPNSGSGYEFKLLTGFYTGKEDIFNGTGELKVRLTESNSLEEIEIRAQGRFLSAPDEFSYDQIVSIANSVPEAIASIDTSLIQVEDVPKPSIDATLSGYASFRFNFTKKEFAGKVAAYLNTPGGAVRGTGTDGALCVVDIFFGKRDWWIWIGEPTPGRRAGVFVDAQIIEAGIQAYFDIGTKVPPFPGLPPRVRHLGKQLDLGGNRASSFAFACGASFNFLFDATVAGTGVTVDIGGGFDVMLRKYEEVMCQTQNGPEELGLDGWYAMGQAWAYLDGAIKLFGFNIVEAGLATVFQLQAPNPTWGLAALEVRYKVLWHDGTWKGDIEFGDRCNFVSTDPDNEFGMNVIIDMVPEDGMQDVAIDGNIKVNFVLPLADTIPEYAFFTGSPRPLTFEINEESLGIFNEDGPVECDIIMDKHINSLILKPKNFLARSDSFWCTVTVDIFDDYNYHSSQSRTVGFKTANEQESIPLSNIYYTYPSNGMTNFHLEQHAGQIGYIQLIKGQTNLFDRDEIDEDGNVVDYTIQAKFTPSQGESFYTELTYDPINYLLTYDMSSDLFSTNTMYRLDIIKVVGQIESLTQLEGLKAANSSTTVLEEDRILYSMFFRTSNFKTVKDKLQAVLNPGSVKSEHNESTIRDEDETQHAYLKTRKAGTGEVFDVFDLQANGSDKAYVELVATHNIFVLGLELQDWRVFVNYDDDFWPLGYNFYSIVGGGYAGVYAASIGEVEQYRITENNYSNNSFSAKTGQIKLACVDQLPGPVGIQAYYNYPDGRREPILEAFDDEFFTTEFLLRTYTPEAINLDFEYEIPVTSEVEEHIENTNQ